MSAPAKERFPVECVVCGAVRMYTSGQMLSRPNLKYCSRKCMGEASRVSGARLLLRCGVCGKEFERMRSRVKGGIYCSKECYAAARRVEGARWRDKEKIKEYMRGYTAANREKHNQQSSQWAREHREQRNENQRKRRRCGWGKGRRGKLRAQVIEKYGEVCLACGATENIEMDHVVPVAAGGANTLENLQPLCRACNRAKGASFADYRSGRHWWEEGSAA